MQLIMKVNIRFVMVVHGSHGGTIEDLIYGQEHSTGWVFDAQLSVLAVVFR